MDKILDNINKAIDEYRDLDLFDYLQLSEILRELTANLFYLEKHRREYYETWLDIYHMTTGTNAAKEREADNKVRELYMIRRLMSSSYKVVDAIRSQISIYKKEG